MANKTRVPVRGSIGKSVRINTQPTAAQTAAAVQGVNILLPDGTTTTLAALAAQIAALNNQPGNIGSPIGGTPVLFSQIQYVPPNVLYTARMPYQEEDSGEEYGRMAIPGPIGPRGLQGFAGMPADDPDDALMIPGPQGIQGVPGSNTSSGGGIIMQIFADDPEDPLPIPGAAGAKGATGLTGSQGLTVFLTPDDPDDVTPIPGQQGTQGIAGLPGVNGMTLFMTPDDPDDTLIVPGPQGLQGIQGAQGLSGSSAGGWAAQFALDDNFEDTLTALRALPPNPQFQSMSIGSTQYPWTPNAPSIDIGAGGSIFGYIDGQMSLAANLYFDGSNFRYKKSNAASLMTMAGTTGSISCYTIPTGTAGNVATTTIGLTLLNSGYLGVGSAFQASSPDSLFHVALGSSPSATTAGFRIGYSGGSNNYFDADTQTFRTGNQLTNNAIISATYGVQANAFRNLSATALVDFTPTSYGTMRVSGAVAGGYTGVMVNDGTFGPTLMAASGASGIYQQTVGRWLVYEDGTSVKIVGPSKGISILGAAQSVGGYLNMGSTTTTTASNGTAQSLPPLCAGYLIWNLNGTTIKVPYFPN